MSVHLITTSTLLLLFSAPAFADCAQELQGLKAAVTAAETGASSAETGMPATEHQEEVLAGSQQSEASGAVGSGATKQQSTVPASPHQQQALGGAEAGKMASDPQASELVNQAHKMAAVGDEAGCMAKLAETKKVLGIN